MVWKQISHNWMACNTDTQRANKFYPQEQEGPFWPFLKFGAWFILMCGGAAGQPGPHPINHRLNMAHTSPSHKYGRQHQHTVLLYSRAENLLSVWCRLNRDWSQVDKYGWWDTGTPLAALFHTIVRSHNKDWGLREVGDGKINIGSIYEQSKRRERRRKVAGGERREGREEEEGEVVWKRGERRVMCWRYLLRIYLGKPPRLCTAIFSCT